MDGENICASLGIPKHGLNPLKHLTWQYEVANWHSIVLFEQWAGIVYPSENNQLKLVNGAGSFKA